MKHRSVRFQLTLWFSVAMLIVVALTCTMVLWIDHAVMQKNVRDHLIQAIENNYGEIAFVQNVSETHMQQSGHQYMAYRDGYLEIDRNFLDRSGGVYTSLCDEQMNLLYGENPIATASDELAQDNLRIRTVKVGGVQYYVLDRKLQREGLDGLWLRGVVSEKEGDTQFSSVVHLSLLLLPPIAFLAILGGYLLAGKMLRPLRDMAQTAEEIEQSGDLHKRIEVDDGKGELKQLAQQFNRTFERLENAFEAEKQFSSDVSHELRTPMSVIMAQCELSLEEEQTQEEYREALRVIQRQGGRMSRMIQDMLTFARMDNNPNAFLKEEVSLSETVTAVCEELVPFAERGIMLSWEIQGDAHVQGNQELLMRMCTNLITNAFRYGNENGFVRVKLVCGQENAVLSVQDNGIGIAPQDLDKIFRRFYRAESARSSKGTGLGLAMVEQIARLHGASVRVDSELEKGSTFTVQFDRVLGE